MRGIRRRMKRYAEEPGHLHRRDALKRALLRRELAYAERRRTRASAEFDAEAYGRFRLVKVERRCGRRILFREAYWV